MSRVLLASLFICLIGGCTSVTSMREITPSEPGYGIDVEFVEQQEKFSCGAAALETVSKYWDMTIKQEELIKAASEEARERGFSIGQLKAYAFEKGLNAVSFSGDIQDIFNHLSKGRPIIVALSLPYNEAVKGRVFRDLFLAKGLSLFLKKYSHFVVVVGGTSSKVYVMDPLVGIEEYSTKIFIKRWSARGSALLIVTS